MTTTDPDPAIPQRNILLRISYDGTHFHGWQKQLRHGQESFRTVQGEIEQALALLHKHPVELFGSGRTDAGVHACGQAAHFFTDIARIKPESFIPALNSALPKDVRIMEAVHVSDNLHARFSAKWRTYHYYIHLDRDPFVRFYSYALHHAPDFHEMNRAASLLTETADFGAFCKSHSDAKTTLCQVREARWIQLTPTRWYFRISANRFLRNMVRAVVGTLFQVGKGRLSVEDFAAVVEAKDRGRAGSSAPGHALYLEAVGYPEELYLD